MIFIKMSWWHLFKNSKNQFKDMLKSYATPYYCDYTSLNCICNYVSLKYIINYVTIHHKIWICKGSFPPSSLFHTERGRKRGGGARNLLLYVLFKLKPSELPKAL